MGTGAKFKSPFTDTDRQLSALAATEQNNTPVIMEFTDIDNFGQNWVYEAGSLKAYNGAQCLDVTGKSLSRHFKQTRD